ncbi:hypothetical protein [Burkholderia pseudomallei]|uniref:hypothetical protein n=1 Tax=Burkholderia pseudomallei TaxID=28450 RepID=UPI001A9EDF9C|nr:hypothetical protein [Burkholderia pseudomallei]QTB47926.1 hypothetical protein J3C54_11140 [Burkholderia pseudomallei]
MSVAPASRLLIEEPPLMVLPQLAARIGLNEAIILQQVHYWTRDNRNVIEGRSWTYNTVADWQKQFPFWSQATIRRTIDSLVEKGLLIKKKLADNKMDATLWYSVDLEKLVDQAEQVDVRKMSKSDAQDAQMSSAQNEQIPNRTETSSETTTESGAATSSQLSLLESTKKSKRPARSEVTFAEYLAVCKALGVKAIPGNDSIFNYIDDVGIPDEIFNLHWFEFRARYKEDSAKRYKDWRAVYRKSVRGNWFRLWYFDSHGQCCLTTAGEQLRREREATAK